jgi:hypothetical protein
MDPRGRDQFVVRHGDETEVHVTSLVLPARPESHSHSCWRMLQSHLQPGAKLWPYSCSRVMLHFSLSSTAFSLSLMR